jgi:hypothetical protein
MMVPRDHVRIARVVGENEDGLTLFVPKDEQGEFHLEGGERFLTMIFTHQNPHTRKMETWIPWEGDTP